MKPPTYIRHRGVAHTPAQDVATGTSHQLSLQLHVLLRLQVTAADAEGLSPGGDEVRVAELTAALAGLRTKVRARLLNFKDPVSNPC